MFEQFTNELDVFRSACRQFTECEIVLLKAPAYGASWIFYPKLDQTIFLAIRKRGGFR